MTSINENIEKQLAIMKEEGQDFFLMWEGDEAKIYEGKEEHATEDWLLHCNTEEGELTFEEWLAENYEELDVEEYDEDDNDWLVCTDSEADDKWEEELDHYIEECIYPTLEGTLRNYFDEEKWKRDARYDGRGHSLARYDGEECEQEIEGTTYYLYRQN